MVFYPFDFTYVCPTELISFSERLGEFKQIEAEVLGVSTDSHFTHLAWKNTPRDQGGLGQIEYPLLADISKDISRNYGVLVETDGDGMRGAALRGLFIIDPEGKVRSVQVNDDAVGRSVDEALRLIKAFQFADKNGEVCPANWKPGDSTIKPDQTAKMEFFKHAYPGSESSKKLNTNQPNKPFIEDPEAEAWKGYPQQEPEDKSKFSVTFMSPPLGDKIPTGAKVKVHYTGTLVPEGTKFDSSVDRGQPFEFQLAQGMVIKCWDQGISMLHKGQKAVLNCPPSYAYGTRGAGNVIPPNATLRFEVEVLDYGTSA